MSERHTYILRLPADLRAAMEEEAQASERSLNEVIRQALCAHYRLDCSETTRGRRDVEGSPENFPLRVERVLFERVRADADAKGFSVREYLTQILNGHFIA